MTGARALEPFSHWVAHKSLFADRSRLLLHPSCAVACRKPSAGGEAAASASVAVCSGSENEVRIDLNA